MSFIEPPANPNYAATVFRVPAVVEFPNRDRIVGVPVFGHQAITPKGVQVGDLMVAFTAETQLSEPYAYENNLYRDAAKNRDPETTGYLENNRRVRAIKFAGNRSDALLMPLSSLAFTGVDTGALQEGDTFDALNGVPVCHKYVVRGPKPSRGQQAPRPRAVDARVFPEHIDTKNVFREWDSLARATGPVVVTQKLHGTSIRVGRVPAKRKLTWRDRIAKRFGAKVQETEMKNVYGSRKVIKDCGSPDQNHYYDTDIWTAEGRKLDGLIPDGFVVYGELIGWTPDGKPIQRGYTYYVPQGQARLYVYRVTTVNEQGVQVDLTWNQVEAFCASVGLETVPTLDYWQSGELTEEDPRWYLDKRLLDETGLGIPVDDGKVDEGVVFRAERWPNPLLLKAKSPKFLEHETKLLDEGVEDTESVQAA